MLLLFDHDDRPIRGRHHPAVLKHDRRRTPDLVVGQGVRVRLYVPFAIGWRMAIAYLRRRLDEYPTMAFLVLKNWFLRG